MSREKKNDRCAHRTGSCFTIFSMHAFPMVTTLVELSDKYDKGCKLKRIYCLPIIHYSNVCCEHLYDIKSPDSGLTIY